LRFNKYKSILFPACREQEKVNTPLGIIKLKTVCLGKLVYHIDVATNIQIVESYHENANRNKAGYRLLRSRPSSLEAKAAMPPTQLGRNPEISRKQFQKIPSGTTRRGLVD